MIQIIPYITYTIGVFVGILIAHRRYAPLDGARGNNGVIGQWLGD